MEQQVRWISTIFDEKLHYGFDPNWYSKTAWEQVGPGKDRTPDQVGSH